MDRNIYASVLTPRPFSSKFVELSQKALGSV